MRPSQSEPGEELRYLLTSYVFSGKVDKNSSTIVGGPPSLHGTPPSTPEHPTIYPGDMDKNFVHKRVFEAAR